MHMTLLRRKLTIPPVWEGAVRRERLVSMLNTAIKAGSHVAMIAGSGYGKTTLLADWCRQQDRNAAWLSLDSEDADLDTFLAYLLATIESVLPGFHSEAHGLLERSRERQGALATLTTLLADLDEQVDRAILLVLDDYHLAESSSLNELIVRLIKYLPARIRLVLASRTIPEIKLRAWQVKRELCVLGEVELAFDLNELKKLRPDLLAEQLSPLLASSGGWPAALGMTPGMLDAYLDEQVLQGQPAEIKHFLALAAIAESFDAKFCEEALGIPFTDERRDWLLRHRLILPLGEERFELPQPVRNMLRRRGLPDISRADRLVWQRRIGDYFWGQGQALSAIRCWIEAEEADRAAKRIVDIAEEWLQAGRLEALAHVIDAVGTAGKQPELWLAEGEIHRRWGDFERAQERFEKALAGFTATGHEYGKALSYLRQAQAFASCGRVDSARDNLAKVKPTLASNDRWQADMLNLEGGLELLAGHAKCAAEHFEASLRLARRMNAPYVEARAAHNLGVCYTKLGEFRQALGYYDAALSCGQKQDVPMVWMTPINRALVLIYLERVAQAQAAAEQALEMVRRFKLAREEGYALRTLGYAYVKQNEFDRAASCFEAAEQLARRASDHLGIAYSLNYRADLAAISGESETALRLSAEAMELASGAETLVHTTEFAHVRAKILVSAGRHAEAQPLIESLLSLASNSGYKYLQHEVERLSGTVARSEKRLDDAERREQLARELAASEGYGVAAAFSQTRITPELTIRCFGGMKIIRQGSEIGEREWQSARAKLLLAFLLCHPEGATKSRLLEALYASESTTEASLHMNLMRLRKALEPELEKGQPSRYVLRSEGLYVFNRQARVWFDVWSFENALRATPPGREAAEIRQLRLALELYAGDFLPEFDNDWVIALRQRFRDRALGACRRLIVLLGESEPSGTLEVVQRALEIDPLAEEFHREIILRFLESEEPHRALEHYQLCERRYQEMLGMNPPEDLAMLVAGLRNHLKSWET
ncbi:MAG: tetratricopeptide repeat protein [Cyanobacteria bacterium NC_groundwater_1444_Ag_S-0.65um_54_12]|nr:tetratricopeptide repeat protein [Cyanobacteria bacterium NC_groundwater_1444_Ag_S-0.65um_54_12]